MNDQLNQALLQIINDSKDGIKAGISFLTHQIPEVIQQLLLWNFAFYVSWIIIGFIFGALSLKFFINLYKKQAITPVRTEKGRMDQEEVRLLMMIPGFTGLISVVIFISNVFNALEIYLAPKVWLIEYAATLVKGHQ